MPLHSLILFHRHAGGPRGVRGHQVLDRSLRRPAGGWASGHPVAV